MSCIQNGILAPVPRAGRFLSFSISDVAALGQVLQALAALEYSDEWVIGMGQSLALALDHSIPGLSPFPSYIVSGQEIPVTQDALWCWLRGEDAGALHHAARRMLALLSPAFKLNHSVSAFKHGAGLDLTGYEDGLENPQEKAALAAAIVSGKGNGLDGSSYVAVQQWLHDFDRFERMSPTEQDHSIGRRKSDSIELEDAPESAHVKRTAQESFSPEAFVLRRSMPWVEADQAGLVFVAFGHSLAAFEAQLRRMVGAEDGIVDALFGFSRPITGEYYWCPPVRDNHLDLRALGFD